MYPGCSCICLWVCLWICLWICLSMRIGHFHQTSGIGAFLDKYERLLVVNTCASDCLERLVPEMIYYVSRLTLNSTHSLTHSLTHSVKFWVKRSSSGSCWKLHFLASCLTRYLENYWTKFSDRLDCNITVTKLSALTHVGRRMSASVLGFKRSKVKFTSRPRSQLVEAQKARHCVEFEFLL